MRNLILQKFEKFLGIRCGITTGSLAAMLEFADQQNDTTLEEQDFELLRGKA